MYVFVYGTLKRGKRNHEVMDDSNFLGIATTKNADFDLISIGNAYPGMIGGEYRVLGETYDVDTHTLSRLDRLEGSSYSREEIEIQDSDGNVVDAWVYLYRYAEQGGWKWLNSTRIVRYKNSAVEWV